MGNSADLHLTERKLGVTPDTQEARFPLFRVLCFWNERSMLVREPRYLAEDEAIEVLIDDKGATLEDDVLMSDFSVRTLTQEETVRISQAVEAGRAKQH